MGHWSCCWIWLTSCRADRRQCCPCCQSWAGGLPGALRRPGLAGWRVMIKRKWTTGLSWWLRSNRFQRPLLPWRELGHHRSIRSTGPFRCHGGSASARGIIGARGAFDLPRRARIFAPAGRRCADQQEQRQRVTEPELQVARGWSLPVNCCCAVTASQWKREISPARCPVGSAGGDYGWSPWR